VELQVEQVEKQRGWADLSDRRMRARYNRAQRPDCAKVQRGMVRRNINRT
jgi:hypothetical protein